MGVIKTKEQRFVELLSGKESFTVEEIIEVTGFSMASVKMYTSAEYLKRKNKPYKIIITETKDKKKMYRLEIKNGKK